MSGTKIPNNMSPKLLEVTERAKRPNARFLALAHLIDVPALERAYGRLRKKAAVGVDGVSVEKYGENLEVNLQNLHHRMKSKKYRHQPLRRTFVQKEDGSQRPIGISATEDKIVQGALREVLEAVYEPVFYEGSYGFRPGRSAHQILRFLDRAAGRNEINWVLEADIKSFFDSINRQMLQEMLQKRVPDGSIKRLVGKCLKVGVLEGEELSWSEDGTTQGSIISPLFGNIYLHYVLDEWFEATVKPKLSGKAHLVRYADDFVLTFEKKEDAERVMAVLPKRMEKHGLQLHPEKTRLVPFKRPERDSESKKGPGSFDLVGFTFYWKRSRTGSWTTGIKTRRKSSTRFIQNISRWCRSHRHLPVKEQHRTLRRKLNGHLNYFGINGNQRSMSMVIYQVKRIWGKWLRRRSQKAKKLSWKRYYSSFLKTLPLPKVRVRVQIWGRA